MLCRNPLHEQVAALLSRALTLDVPSPDTDLFETGILDSLAFVELLVQLEREFGVTVSLDDLEVDNFRTIARIAEFVAGGIWATDEAGGVDGAAAPGTSVPAWPVLPALR